MFSAYQTEGITRYRYDPTRAKQLLELAGESAGFDIEFAIPESGNGMQQPVATVGLHGGTVDVTSRENIGTSITVRLPLFQEADGRQTTRR